MFNGVMQENFCDLTFERLNAYRAHFNLDVATAESGEEEVLLITESGSYSNEQLEEEEYYETESLNEDVETEELLGQENYIHEEIVYEEDVRSRSVELEENIIYIAEEEADPNIMNQKTDDEKFFKFTCDLCDHPEFAKMKLLAEHCKVVHNTLPKVKCCSDDCDSVLSTWRRLWIHKEKHFPSSDRLRCPTCQKTYVTAAALENHIKKHNTPYICTHCGKSFREIKTLRWHEHTHLKPLHERKKHKCSYPGCEATFITKQACQNHIAMKHEKTFVSHCKEEGCDKSFYTKKSYYEHLKNTHGERKYMCDQCNFKARNKHAINVHREIHNEGKVYSCDLCSATFSVHRRLKDHMSKLLKQI